MRATTPGTPWMAHHRITFSWIPGVLFFAAILFDPHQLREGAGYEMLEQVGYALIMIATMGRVWCSIYIAGRKARELCQDGPYSVCRNPLYLFSYLGVIGVALAAKNPWLAGIVTPVYWIYYAVVIRTEERHLAGIFGEPFEAYRQKVPAVIPKVSLYWTRPEFAVFPKKVLQGILDASWFLWFIILLEIIEQVKEVFFAKS